MRSTASLRWMVTRRMRVLLRMHEETFHVARNAGGHGVLQVGCFTLIFLLIPIVGHILATVLVLADDLTLAEKILWLVVVWVFWPIGPFLYLLLGQRRTIGARAS
ncbi:MAG: hypothetical protein OJF49_002364 [Ktedonobacterales bacterium]|nr:MAG: hypothetical protein OJF49_002364 [Ktedonobacterales bacterium]